jgi:hypothetical protein
MEPALDDGFEMRGELPVLPESGADRLFSCSLAGVVGTSLNKHEWREQPGDKAIIATTYEFRRAFTSITDPQHERFGTWKPSITVHTKKQPGADPLLSWLVVPEGEPLHRRCPP